MSKFNGNLNGKIQQVFEDVVLNWNYVTDQELYGEPDYVRPDLVTFKGDCEDCSVSCRVRARQLGIRRGNIVYCYDETGGGHAVYEIDGWVLDNRFKWPMTTSLLKAKGYKFIAMTNDRNETFEVANA